MLRLVKGAEQGVVMMTAGRGTAGEPLDAVHENQGVLLH